MKRIGLDMLSIDPMRIGEALSRPGIDPRTWTTLAVVTAVHVSAVGVYVNITTIAGIEETASVPAIYGGPGFGLYCPVAVGDCVVVAVPEGEWGAGARVIAQVWDQGSPPPQEAIDNPRDIAIVVEPEQSIRIIVSGGGDVVIEARDNGKVRLGSESASRGVARQDDDVGLSAVVGIAELQTLLDTRYALRPSPPPATLPAGARIGVITTSSKGVKSS